MMQRERTLTILYDLISTIGSEISLQPMLRRVLQRFMFHTGFPVGIALLQRDGHCTIAQAIGNSEARSRMGDAIALPADYLIGEPRYIDMQGIAPTIPCRSEQCRNALLLPIEGRGCLILLTPAALPEGLNPLIFSAVLGNLGRGIELCHNNDLRQQSLAREVEDRTRELHNSEEYIRLLLTSTAEAIYGVDPQGICTFANQSFLDMLGFDDVEEVLGEPVHDLIHHSHPDGEAFPADQCPGLKAYISGSRINNASDTFWRRDGTAIPVEFSIFPVRRGDEYLGSVASFRDMTGALALQQEKDELRNRAESAQRLESLGLLAGGIAHDFNNILTAIMANAGLLRKQLGSEQHFGRYIESILDASQSAADLCRQMLAYSGQGKFVVRNIDLSALVLQMSKLLEVSIGKQVRIQYELGQGLRPVHADVSQMQQIIMNLITNANEAIGGKAGVIRLHSSQLQIAAGHRLDAAPLSDPLAPGTYICLEVSDDGCGMNESLKQRMFEPFFTTKSNGRGLGMSAILGIVRSHDGAIEVLSQPGEGATIRLYLPAAEGTSDTVEEHSPSRKQWRGRGSILVVDDEPDVLEVATAILEDVGFTLYGATNGRDGVAEFSARQDEIVAVLLDMNMPGMNGHETFKALRNIDPGIKVMLSSGYCEQEVTADFVGEGSVGFIQKPYMPSALEHAIQALLDGESDLP